jgi:hypothetical protein
MLRRRLPLALFVAAACTCETDASKHQYTCTTLRDCVDGFVCVAGICVPQSGDAGTGGGGTTDGGGAAGGGSALGGGSAAGGGSALGGGSATGGGGVAQAAAVVIKSGPQSVIQGGCSSPVTIQVQDAQGQPFVVSSPLTVSLMASPTTAITFSGSGCSTAAVTSVVVQAGASSATFQFKAAINGMVTLFISAAGLTGDSQMETLLPIVRRGACALMPMAATVDCPISPPQSDITHTALFFQAIGADATPSEVEVRCQLVDATKITCDRAGMATAVSIGWQTLEPPDGALNVERYNWQCNNMTSLMAGITPVDAGATFLLRSYREMGGYFNDNDFFTAQLTDPMTVTLQSGAGNACGNSDGTPMQGEVQVVQVSGATVTRGSTGAVPGNTATVSGLPNVAGVSTALLFSYRGTDPGTILCDRVVRGNLASATSIDFSRGMSIGDAGCTGASLEDIAWERVDFGAKATVHAFSVFMDAGVTTAMVPQPNGTDPTRMVVLMTAQGAAGQGAGESEDLADDVPGEANAACALGTSATTVMRGSGKYPALFSGQFIQWNP